MWKRKASTLALAVLMAIACADPDASQGNNAVTDPGTPATDAGMPVPDTSTDDTSPENDAGTQTDTGDTSVDPGPVTCEAACDDLAACLIAQCSGFNQAAEAQLTGRCLDQCTPALAQTFTNRTCEENIDALREQQPFVADACPPTDNNGDGLHMLYIGHSFGRAFAAQMPDFAANVGIENHRTSVVFSGGASGAPLALWENDEKRTDAQAILDEGEVDVMVMICCSEPWLETGDDPGIVNWMTYALEDNPNASFGLAMPWIDFPESYETAAEYSGLWEQGYAQWQGTVDSLRTQFPGVEIFTIPHGRASGDLRTLFEMDALPEVTALRGPADQSIYTDAKGHAGEILKDFGGLIWLGSIYGVDVSEYDFGDTYVTDLGGLAQTIVSEDDYTRTP